MKTKKFFIGMAFLLILTGCGKVPTLSNGQEAVVSLKNSSISVDDLYTEMKDKYALSVLLDMIDEKILNEKYTSTEEEKKYIESMKEQTEVYYEYLYKEQYSSYESFIQAYYGVKSSSELDDVFALSYRRNQVVKEYAKKVVSDSEIKKYYDEEIFGDISASHILITADYDDSATDEEKKKAEEEALATAKEIINKLNKGEDFATLAKTYSKDGSAEKGGAVGEFNRGDMVDEFLDAASKLKVNEYTKEPVKTKFGYHIILKTGQKEKAPLEDVKAEIVETLSEEKIEKSETIKYEALIQLRKDAGIKIEDKNLQDQYENYIYNVTK